MGRVSAARWRSRQADVVADGQGVIGSAGEHGIQHPDLGAGAAAEIGKRDGRHRERRPVEDHLGDGLAEVEQRPPGRGADHEGEAGASVRGLRRRVEHEVGVDRGDIDGDDHPSAGDGDRRRGRRSKLVAMT